MQPDFDKSAAAMVAGTHKAIQAAVAPLLKRIEMLEARKPEKGEKGETGERGEMGQRGETGVGVAGAMIDRSGVLVLTLSDGTQRDLGPVVGKDGSDGQNGADGPPGEPGKDGRDGFSLEDFDVRREDDGRTLVLSFDAGEIRHEYEIIMPHMAYCGVYKQDQDYMVGDVVTWGGCAWHCDQPTKEKPDIGPWTLMVKKGRDGKDAKNG